MILVRDDIRNGAEQCFQKLIGRIKTVETAQRNRILHSWIVCVKCNDIGDAHCIQFFQRQRAVQRLSLGTLVLAAS